MLSGHRRPAPTRAQRKRAEGFVAQAFTDAIAWKAARTILARVQADPASERLDPELRESLDRFLERHP